MKVPTFFNKKWNYISFYAFGFFLISNIVWFLFYFYSDDWMIGDSIKTMYGSWKIIFNPLLFISGGIFLGYRSWRKNHTKSH